jgi:hypothetical protein
MFETKEKTKHVWELATTEYGELHETPFSPDTSLLRRSNHEGKRWSMHVSRMRYENAVI